MNHPFSFRAEDLTRDLGGGSPWTSGWNGSATTLSDNEWKNI